MSIQYFPRLDESHAMKIIEQLLQLPLTEASQVADFNHPQAYYYPTAADFVSEDELRQFRAEVMTIADELGFPEKLGSNEARELDQRLSGLLYENLKLVPAEAGNPEIWNFLSLVVLPDITKWRYPNEKKVLDYNRWLGGDRNVLRKLWWREATLGHELNSKIGEDEAVAIMERPLLGGQPPVARAMVRALLKVSEEYPTVARSELMRAGAVNLRRYAPFTAFEIFTDEEIETAVLDIFYSASTLYVERKQEEKEPAANPNPAAAPVSTEPPAAEGKRRAGIIKRIKRLNWQ